MVFDLKRIPKWVAALLRIVLGVVFVYASWHKLLQPAQFAQAVANYQLLPEALVGPVALGLPWFEMICGVCLIVGRLARGAAALLAIMLGVFIAALATSLYRGLDIHCGCFSLKPEGASNLKSEIVLNLFLLVLALFTWRWPGGTRHRIGEAS